MSSEPSQPRPARPRPPRRHSSNNGKYDGPTLGAIDEDGGMAPDIPPKAHHRQFARMFHLVPLLHFDREPESRPPTLLYDFEKILGPNGEKLADVRRNWRGRSRGGLKRLVMLIAVSILLIVGLIVGLVLGLKKRGSSSKNFPHKTKALTEIPFISNSAPPSSSPSASPSAFPAGTYSITTYLTTLTTACTSNPSTWRCYPYALYSNASAASSLTTFSWVITPTHLTASNFLISSTVNPFSISFANASLTLVDSGLESEAYAFTIPSMQKIVIPNVALTDDGMADTCYFNDTLFQARLYTKMPRTYPEAATVAGGGVQAQDWPYAVSVQQTIEAGDGVPDCYKTVNGDAAAVGEHVDVATAMAGSDGDTQCACGWSNFDR
ncbi:MAG: hypothetical protein Q9160_000528 [Pyrenula sp. 1 TL-2023]